MCECVGAICQKSKFSQPYIGKKPNLYEVWKAWDFCGT